jgi:hypothetical protein
MDRFMTDAVAVLFSFVLSEKEFAMTACEKVRRGKWRK